MDCGCDYCTDPLCDIEETLKNHPTVKNVEITRVVHVTTTIEGSKTLSEIHGIEANLLEKYPQANIDFRILVKNK